MSDLIAVLVKCIIYIEDCTAGITKNCIHTLLFQTLNYNFCSC